MASAECEWHTILEAVIGLTVLQSGVLAGATAATASFPGPLISGNKVCVVAAFQFQFLTTGCQGDTFRVNVIDQLTDSSSMLTTTSIVSTLLYRIMNQTFNSGVQHWHGIFQEGTQWADGPSFVTQCPIVPGESFLYQFTVPDQAGSFWYHSHHGM
jgi:iron transport multicopper oxidase